MDADLHRRATELFTKACDLPPDERDAFVSEECGDDAALAREVRSLLAFDAASKAAFLDDGAPAPASASLSSSLSRRLDELRRSEPRYALGDEIARGGMGAILEVFDERLRRSLAMKVILEAHGDAGSRPSSANPESLARFLEEAQITGQLEHPGVVPVHELGVDADGQVYFTMRLVRGDDLRHVLTRLADGDETWTLPRVLEVLRRVCETMAFAHDRGIVHRDLKPANVMVGGYGEVYVMDWGLARVAGREDAPDLTVRTDRADELRDADDSSLRTMDGAVLGTPGYMSPEQARGDLDAVDARSDVYAVGAMLYHALAGRMPYLVPGEKVGPLEFLERVKASAPAPLEDVAPELAAICEKAMARAPDDRYATMQELAGDLRAFHEHRVVRAYRTGALVELRKWVERNRALAASAAVALLILVAAVSFVAVRESRHATAIAAERDVARSVVEFQKETFAINAWEDGTEVSALELIDRSAARVAEAYADSPDVEIEVRNTIAHTYLSLGEYAKATEQFRRAHAIEEARSGAFSPATLVHACSLTNALQTAGMYNEAAELAAEVLEHRLARLGPDHLDTLHSRSHVIDAMTSRGEHEAALEMARDVRDRLARATSSGDPLRDLADRKVAACLEKSGHHDEAIAILEEVLGRERARDGRWLLSTMASLAHAFGHVDRHEEAEELQRRILETTRERVGEDHPRTFAATKALARTLSARGRHEEAEAAFRSAWEGQRRVLGDLHPVTLNTQTMLAFELRRIDRHEEEEELLLDTLEKRRVRLGPDHVRTMGSLLAVATALASHGKVAESAAAWRELRDRRTDALGADHPDTVEANNKLMLQLAKEGDDATRETPQRAVLEWQLEHLGPDHRDTVRSMWDLSGIYYNLGRFDEELPLRRAVLEYALEHWPSQVGPARGNLAGCLEKLGRFAEAEPLLRENLVWRREQHGADHVEAVWALNAIASSVRDQRRFAEAAELYREVVERRARTHGPDHEMTRWAERDLAFALNNDAWQTIRRPDADPESFTAALDDVFEARSLLPDWFLLEHSIGVAEYRRGDDRAAIGTLTRALELESAREVPNFRAHALIFLAMAHRRLGETAQANLALAGFDAAMEGVDDAELREFREEARALFGS